jgi:crotonobetainyl-CoA:carnitine CoA-transferase CaiB-like acyl-CoA transferase
MLGRQDWAADPRYRDAASRSRFDDQLIADLAAALAQRDAAGLERLAADSQVACVAADTAGGDDFFLGHRQSTGNGFVVEAGHPGIAPYRRAGCAARFSLTPGTARVAHQFGQDGPAILAELGYTGPEIEKWTAAGVLVTPATAGR